MRLMRHFISSIKSYLNIDIYVLNKDRKINALKDKVIFNILRHTNLVLKYFVYRIFLPLIIFLER